ncbi:hypothetical protein GCM10009850_012500 [Nonomuraea monospora]|uniref:Uncharacterized protein n=1 Tax=Nonomuraea monospora TaxID=568818 RepID=A0ABN3C9A4_9ACTN
MGESGSPSEGEGVAAFHGGTASIHGGDSGPSARPIGWADGNRSVPELVAVCVLADAESAFDLAESGVS